MNKILNTLILIFFFYGKLFSFGENINIIRPCADTVFIELPPTDYPITEDNLPYYTTSVKVGHINNDADFYISLDYPVFQTLKADEVKVLQQYESKIYSQIKVNKHLGYSRKQGYLDISFCPIIKDENVFKRLVSCKINIKTKNINTKILSDTQNSSNNRWKTKSVLAEGKWVKIKVNKEGIFALTPAFLSKKGFNDPSKVKLFGYGGRIIEENWSFDDNRRVSDDLEEIPLYRKDDGTALFFAEGTVRWTYDTNKGKWLHENNPYSKYSYYFITEGDHPAEMETVTSQKATSKTIKKINYYAVIDNDAFGWYEGGREMYDSYDFAYGNTKTYKLKATSRDESANKSIVDVSFTASSTSSTTKVAVSHNDKALGTLSIPRYANFQSAYETRRSFTSTSTDVDNNIKLTVSPNNPSRLNFIRINYTRTLVATDEAYSFSPNTRNAVVLEIQSANENHRLWRIGTAEKPTCEIAGKLEGNVLKMKVDDGMDRFVILDLNKNYPSPEWDEKVENQNLHGDLKAYDMVIIIPESRHLLDEATRLSEAHKKAQGLRVKIVDAGQLFNEFSSGTPDASAYRRYMKMLYDRATTDKDMPRYLLLFGDCAWDNRMISDKWSSYSPKDFLLSFEVTDGFSNQNNSQFALGEQNSYVTDDFFGWLDDNEGTSYSSNKIDLSIGRFTCHDTNTAKILVDKSIDYLNNNRTGPWKNTIYVLADHGNGNLHMNDAEEVIKQIDKSTENKAVIKKVYNDAYKRISTGTGHSFPTVTTLLQEALKQGALVFNYTGHGSPDQLSHAKILVTKDFEAPTSGNLPLWIMASCEISPFDSQKHDLGRAAIHNAQGGAISVMCASRAVFSNYNRNLNIAYNRHLFAFDKDGKQNTMGDALRLAKVELVTPSGFNEIKDGSINKLKYVLLGDPALPLTAPTGHIALDSINGKALRSNDNIQLSAGSLVRFSGRITDRNDQYLSGFNGSITATVADKMESITCMNNDGTANEPMVYQDRIKKIFEGSDSVTDGKFSISFRVPKDISYSDATGRVTFYAVNKDKTLECHGASEQFHLNGTDTSYAPDSLAPKVYLYLNDPDFPNGGVTAPDPVFFAQIKDDAGINATGIGIGHDMELVIDNDYSNPIILNNNFSYIFGSYREGIASYPLQDLEYGKHTLSFRVWDVNGNSSTSTLQFNVQDGVSKNFDVYATQNPARTTTNFITTFQKEDGESSTAIFEVYSLNGQKIWQSENINMSEGIGYGLAQWNLTNNDGARVPAGIYLYKVTLKVGGHKRESDAKKIIVLAQ